MKNYLITAHGNSMIYPFLGSTYNGSLISFFNQGKFSFEGKKEEIHEKKTKKQVEEIISKIKLNEIEKYFTTELDKITEKTNVPYKVILERKFPYTLSVQFRVPSNVSIVAMCDLNKCHTQREKLKYALSHQQEKLQLHQKLQLENDIFKPYCVFEDYFYDICLSNEEVGNESDTYYYGLFNLPLDKNTHLFKHEGPNDSSHYKTLEQMSTKALKDFDLIKTMSGGLDINTYPNVWKHLNCFIIKIQDEKTFRLVPLSLIVALLSKLNSDTHVYIYLYCV